MRLVEPPFTLGKTTVPAVQKGYFGKSALIGSAESLNVRGATFLVAHDPRAGRWRAYRRRVSSVILAAAYVAAQLVFSITGVMNHVEPVWVQPRDCGKSITGFVQRDGQNHAASARIECERSHG